MFNTVVIVGVGLIGGSLGLAMRRNKETLRVIGVSSSSAVKSALEMGAITEGVGYEELGDAVQNVDAVFLCTPIHRIHGLLTHLSTTLQPGVRVTDVGAHLFARAHGCEAGEGRKVRLQPHERESRGGAYHVLLRDAEVE